jgi:hypothetical protein
MGTNEIKVNGLLVRNHAKKLRTGSIILRTKAASNSVNAGKTNYSGFKIGADCRNNFGTMMSRLSMKIEEDCDNVVTAADVINGLDIGLSMQMNKMDIYREKKK